MSPHLNWSLLPSRVSQMLLYFLSGCLEIAHRELQRHFPNYRKKISLHLSWSQWRKADSQGNTEDALQSWGVLGQHWLYFSNINIFDWNNPSGRHWFLFHKRHGVLILSKIFWIFQNVTTCKSNDWGYVSAVPPSVNRVSAVKVLDIAALQRLCESFLFWTQFSTLAPTFVACKRYFSTSKLGIPTGTIIVRNHHSHLKGLAREVPTPLNAA